MGNDVIIIIISRVSVRLGEYNTDTDEDCVQISGHQDCSEPPMNVPISEAIAHEDYDPHDKNQYHDIALLRLHNEVPYTGKNFN